MRLAGIFDKALGGILGGAIKGGAEGAVGGALGGIVGKDILSDEGTGFGIAGAVAQNPSDNFGLLGSLILPAGEQGPAQGPNIPIKNYGGRYMPDGTQPTGYRPGPIKV